MTRRRRLVLVLALLASLTALAVWVGHMRSEQLDYLLERRTSIAAIMDDSEDLDAGVVDRRLTLRGENALTVRVRLRRDAREPGRRVPVLLVVGGHRTGRDAVALAAQPEGLAYVAIDYPYDGSHRLQGLRETLAAIPAIQDAFLDTPPALSLVVDWLLTQDWTDPERIELVGVSLGVPFAATAGALDERFTRVWLIHGAGDNHAWLAHNLREDFPSDWQRAVMTEVFYTLIYAESFRTARWVEATVPRPVVIIAAHEDERLPEAALAPLPAIAAREPTIELVWTDGLHIDPGRPEVIRQLLDIVLARVRGAPRSEPPDETQRGE